jgi:hypothetical protein
MPGVIVNTAVRSAPTAVNNAPAATFFVVGTAERGPTESTLITSLAQFEAYYGGYNAQFNLHSQIQTFFEEGGSQVYVVRATNSTSSGTLDLDDSGSNPVLTIDAANPGAWSDDLDIAVDTAAGNFVVKVYYQDALVYSTNAVANASAAASDINNSVTAGLYVSATATNGSAAVETAAAAPLVGGAEGSAYAASDWVAELEKFDLSYGAGAVAIPGQYAQDVYDGLVAHGALFNRIAILGVDPSNDTAEEVVAAALTTRELDSAESAAFYFPRVNIPGPGGTTLTVAPDGYVAAKRSVAHNSVGSWQAGAGAISLANFVTGTETRVDAAFGQELDDNGVNAIRIIQGGVRIYGARSASTDVDNFRYITAKDTLNYVAAQAGILMEDLVFSPIDGRRSVFGRVEARLIAVLEPMRSAGGLFEGFTTDGRQIDPGYSVEVSDAINPVTQLAEGIVRAKVGIRVSSTGDQIIIDIIKSNLTSSVV